MAIMRFDNCASQSQTM